MSNQIEIAAAERDLKNAEAALQEARKALQQQHGIVKHTRALLSKCIAAFQAEFAPITRETLVRETIAAEQQYKRDVLAGVIEPKKAPRLANSAVDRHAFYGAGGSADDFARSNMRTGFRRGTTRTLPDGRRVLIPASTRRGVAG
jgi:hypothetical protein